MNSAEEHLQDFCKRSENASLYLSEENYIQALKECSEAIYSLWFSFSLNEVSKKSSGGGIANYRSEEHIACLSFLTQALIKVVRCYIGLQDHQKCIFFLWHLRDIYQALGTFEGQFRHDKLIARYQSYGEELNRYLKDPEFGQSVEDLLQAVSQLSYEQIDGDDEVCKSLRERIEGIYALDIYPQHLKLYPTAASLALSRRDVIATEEGFRMWGKIGLSALALVLGTIIFGGNIIIGIIAASICWFGAGKLIQDFE